MRDNARCACARSEGSIPCKNLSEVLHVRFWCGYPASFFLEKLDSIFNAPHKNIFNLLVFMFVRRKSHMRGTDHRLWGVTSWGKLAYLDTYVASFSPFLWRALHKKTCEFIYKTAPGLALLITFFFFIFRSLVSGKIIHEKFWQKGCITVNALFSQSFLWLLQDPCHTFEIIIVDHTHYYQNVLQKKKKKLFLPVFYPHFHKKLSNNYQEGGLEKSSR